MPEGKQIVAVVGGAVAGSEAVHQLTGIGVHCVVIEQNELPYGKIEDGLPRWHVKQRKKEMDLIDSRIGHELVDFVPNTRIGEDLAFSELYDVGFSAILLANGAWKDRPFPIDEIEKFEGEGFWYQNPFVHWFNHYHEPDYDGEDIPILDNALVVGGGLASIDVVKIIQLELASRALKEREIPVDIVEMERKGIPDTLKESDLSWENLNLKGCLLLYRRDITNMPLAAIPPDAPPAREEAIRNTREKILANAQEKYLFRFQDHRQPVDILVEDGNLVGLRMIETEVVEGKAMPKEGSEHDVWGSMIISSIGSIPEPLEGVPMKWSTYDIESEETGRVNGLEGVFGLGNAITGKGNIRVSRNNSRDITAWVIEHHLASNSVNVEKVRKQVKMWQEKAGYDGDYAAWVKSHRKS